ncbi:MAG: META domain-containing protein [Prevotellaceae bacterium]|jgi:heat shock protein HslJ|nr:META domain-containing protein [Prevotellaceae bacterium]
MKKCFKLLGIIGLSVIMITSCTSKKSAVAVTNDEITGKYWKLVELNGVTVSAEISQTPYIMFDATANRITGTGGCNQLMGSYTLEKEVKRVHFSDVAATLKACLGENVDSELNKVLEVADNYSISADGKRLTLNRARMAPLAAFELGDLK